jgi:phosphatidylglycerol:prolipoprotein diacylglycerol transferase
MGRPTFRRLIMIQELFSIGPISISPFGAMMVAAFLAAFVQLRWGMKYQGIGNEEDASSILLAGGIGGILGAKLYYAILYGDWRLLLDRAGFVWYGGFLLGFIAVVWVIKRRHLPVWQTTDAITPALALGYGVGRIGCFLVGDDFGMPTDKPWGVAFPYGLPGPTTAGLMRNEYGAEVPWEIPDNQLIPVHPTQLYETLAALIICLIGVWLLKRTNRAGTTTLVVIGLLAIERFSIEFLRAKDDRFIGDFTMAQIISVVVLILVIAVSVQRNRRSGDYGTTDVA